MRNTVDGNGYIGAVLVVDHKGIPQEFRCTHPIRPTPTQKALYGANIHSYMTFELSGQQLMDALTTNPVACMVESGSDLLLQDYVTIPVFYAESLGELLEAVDSANGTPDGDQSYEHRKEIEGKGDIDPISIQCHLGYETHLDSLLPLLQQVFRNVDALEPFERISVAVRTLGERDKRFQ